MANDTQVHPSLLLKNRTLRDIVDEMLARIDAADGEVTDALEQLELSMAEKIDGYAAVARQFAAEASAFDDLARGYLAKAASRQAQIGALKQRLADQMDRIGAAKVKGVTSQAYFSTSESVDFNDEEAFCRAYSGSDLVRSRLTPNKTAIKATLKLGVEVTGAHIVITRNLQLR